MHADVLRRHYREPVARQTLSIRDERQRTRGGEAMFVSLTGYALDIRPLRVHVPAFPDSYLSGVDSITESRTVYL